MSRTGLCVALTMVWAAVMAPARHALGQRVPGRCANMLPADAHYERHLSVHMGNVMWPFIILLPSGYSATADTRYPVIYQFHGRTDDECIGPERGLIERVKTSATLAGVGKFIYVFLNGGPICSYRDNSTDCPNQKSESYIMQELIPFIDANYKTIPNRSGRAMDGFSMGGEGVARFGYKYSSQFCSFVAYAGGGAPAELQANRTKILADKLKTRFVVGANESDRIASIMNHYSAVMALNIPTSYEAVPGIGHNFPGYYGYPSMRGEVGARGLKVHFDCFAEAATMAGADGGVGGSGGGGGGGPDGGGDAARPSDAAIADANVSDGGLGTGGGGGNGGGAAGTGGTPSGTGGAAQTASGGSTVVATGGAVGAGTGGATASGSGGSPATGTGGATSPPGGAGSTSGGCGCAAVGMRDVGGGAATLFAAGLAGALSLHRRRRRDLP